MAELGIGGRVGGMGGCFPGVGPSVLPPAPIAC
jgi:hypothetical protein